MAEEEVHGGVEARVQPDEQEDEQVAQHRGQVHAQEQGEEHTLMLWLDGKPQKEELRPVFLWIPKQISRMYSSCLTSSLSCGSAAYAPFFSDCR